MFVQNYPGKRPQTVLKKQNKTKQNKTKQNKTKQNKIKQNKTKTKQFDRREFRIYKESMASFQWLQNEKGGDTTDQSLHKRVVIPKNEYHTEEVLGPEVTEHGKRREWPRKMNIMRQPAAPATTFPHAKKNRYSCTYKNSNVGITKHTWAMAWLLQMLSHHREEQKATDGTCVKRQNVLSNLPQVWRAGAEQPFRWKARPTSHPEPLKLREHSQITTAVRNPWFLLSTKDQALSWGHDNLLI